MVCGLECSLIAQMGRAGISEAACCPQGHPQGIEITPLASPRPAVRTRFEAGITLFARPSYVCMMACGFDLLAGLRW